MGKTHLSILSPSIHIVSNKFDGGQCLSKHGARKNKKPKDNYSSSGNYTEDCSCSYRWQGKNSPNNGPSIYDKDRPELVKIIKTGSRPESVKGEAAVIKAILSNLGVMESGIKVGRDSKKTKSGVYPEKYGRNLRLPRPGKKGDWYVSGPVEAGYKNFKNGSKNKFEEIPETQNFTKQTWPYWHNHHHLIPAGMFKATIREVAEEKNISYRIFCNWLAASPFNIHFMDNMLILPMDMSVAFLLGLPRHLRFPRSHPQYDKYAKKLIRPILKRAANALKKGKEHPSAVKSQSSVADKLYRNSVSLAGELIAMGSTITIPVAADDLHR